MKPYYADESVTLYHGKSEEVLTSLQNDSVDAVVTDPPYELGFMGRAWDASGIAYSVDLWREVWRVLKPGGHLLAFGGTRTVHRLTCAIEDAGFEIRDGIDWLYGSGFPKSLDVSKAIDKRRDDKGDIEQVRGFLRAARDRAGLTNRQVADAFGFTPTMAAHWIDHPTQPTLPRWEQWQRLRELIGFGDEMDGEVWRLNGRKGSPGEAWAAREVVGERTTGIGTGRGSVAYIGDGNRDVTAPATDAARTWEGWGTALKPAREPIVMARKPLAGTVAANVLAYGTGALNVDGCRVEAQPGDSWNVGPSGGGFAPESYERGIGRVSPSQGRWPTNVVLSHAPLYDDEGEIVGDGCADECVPGCPVAELDRQSGSDRGSFLPAGRLFDGKDKTRDVYGKYDRTQTFSYGDTGGASRFYPVFRYEPKAAPAERPRIDGAAHPTVKPLALMRWLISLVAPPGGVVLDPFAGSGTTGEACVVEGFRCVLIEQHEPYLPLIVARLSKPLQPTLFGATTNHAGEAS